MSNGQSREIGGLCSWLEREADEPSQNPGRGKVS